MNHAATAVDTQCINTIRTLAMDAVQKANSGHPGTPMGLAPVGYTLWSRFLRYHPEHPDWPNRDRFVLSVGHASMLLYSLLHLAGVVEIDAHGKRSGQPAISLDDIKQFRQMSSKTPGHPEYRMTIAMPTLLAQPWPSAGWPSASTATVRCCSITTSTPCAVTAT